MRTTKRVFNSIVSLLLAVLLAVAMPSLAWGDDALTWVNEDTGYKAVIIDDAELLTSDEEQQLLADMKPNTAYGNAAVLTGYATTRTTAAWARGMYQQTLGATDGSLFVIDMRNRIIQIHSYGVVYDKVTESYAEAITDNVYAYARDGDYYACAKQVFAQELELMAGGDVPTPMRHIANLLIAITLAVLVNYLFVYFQRRGFAVRKTIDLGETTTANFSMAVLDRRVVKRERATSKDDDNRGGKGGGGGDGADIALDVLGGIIQVIGSAALGGGLGGFGGGGGGGGGGFGGGGGGHSF